MITPLCSVPHSSHQQPPAQPLWSSRVELPLSYPLILPPQAAAPLPFPAQSLCCSQCSLLGKMRSAQTCTCSLCQKKCMLMHLQTSNGRLTYASYVIPREAGTGAFVELSSLKRMQHLGEPPSGFPSQESCTEGREGKEVCPIARAFPFSSAL